MILILTTIVNVSLRTDIMPSHFKGAHVRPVIKKPSIDKDIVNNCRPVFDLPCLSKTIERVAARLSAHMFEYNLCEPNQSVTSQITVSRQPLSVYRMTSCVQ